MARYSIIVSKTGEVLETNEEKWADVKKRIDSLNRFGRDVFARKERNLTPEQKAETLRYGERKDEARETWGIAEINKELLEALKESWIMLSRIFSSNSTSTSFPYKSPSKSKICASRRGCPS